MLIIYYTQFKQTEHRKIEDLLLKNLFDFHYKMLKKKLSI